MRTTRHSLTLALASVATLALAACGSSSSGAGTTAASTTAPAPTSAAQTSAAMAPVMVEDAWVKAADSGMTAMFGTIKNTGSSDVTVVSATSSVSKMLELHEVVMVDGAMKMQPKKGGFTVPAGGTHELKPGGDHVMFMGLTSPVKAGDAVQVTLTLSDGSTVAVDAVGKPFTGANETYAPTPGATTSMSGM